MGLIPNEHKVWIVRIRVPKHLQEAVPHVLGNEKERQTWLQKTTSTKDKREATRRAPAILVEFRKILDEAEALLAERPLRTSLALSEIDRIAEFYFGERLAGDEELTREGGDDDPVRTIAKQLDEAGIDYRMPAPLAAQRPPYGLSDREVTKRNADVAFMLPIVRDALARGDITKVDEAMTELLDRFHLNLDPHSPPYRQLGIALLKAEVRALDALARRYNGEVIDTPSVAHLEPSTAEPAPTGDTLRAAFAGWMKERERSSGTVAEYKRAIELFGI